MIKNIIFDLGNVLYRFDPIFILEQFSLSQSQKEQFLQVIFKSKEWLSLDQGTITEEEALNHMLMQLNPEDHALARDIFMNWHLYLTEIQGMETILTSLKEHGYQLYLLSNTSVRFLTFQSQCSLLRFFDGTFASALYRMIKPDPLIYQTFLSQFHLQAKECLFIDDQEANILGAKKVGLHGYQHTTPTALLDYLKKIHLLS